MNAKKSPTFLGVFPVDISETPYANYTQPDWAIEYWGRYGWIDGAAHKTWVGDQMARILMGTPVIVEVAKWDEGNGMISQEFRISTGTPSEKYEKWIIENFEDYDGVILYDMGLLLDLLEFSILVNLSN